MFYKTAETKNFRNEESRRAVAPAQLVPGMHSDFRELGVVEKNREVGVTAT
jgi:hypothetical protein